MCMCMCVGGGRGGGGAACLSLCFNTSRELASADYIALDEVDVNNTDEMEENVDVTFDSFREDFRQLDLYTTLKIRHSQGR